MAYLLLNDTAFDDPRLRSVADYVFKQLDQKRLLSRDYSSDPARLLLADAARLANMSPEAFCRYFHRQTGVRFHAWQSSLRTEAAAQIILEGHSWLRIEVVGIRVGYKNKSSFSRIFKFYEGIAPGRLKQLVVIQPALKSILRSPLSRRLFLQLVIMNEEQSELVSCLCSLAEQLARSSANIGGAGTKDR